VIEKVKEEALEPHKTFFYIPTTCVACNFSNFPILSDLAFESAGLKGLKIGLINTMAPGEILPQTLAVKILESNILGGIIYKMFHRVLPYEVHKGEAEGALWRARERIGSTILEAGDLRTALSEIVADFEGIERDESAGRKPRIGILGDLYVKYNDLVNQKVQNVVHELGGELWIPSMTEFPFHYYDADARLGDDPRHYKLLKTIEKRYENLARGLIEEQQEPDFAECVGLMEEYKLTHYIVGESSISVGRALYYIKHGLVDAILHVNPFFCCPGVVSSSIFRKVQEDFGIPIIDIFYDGTGSPNKVLIPHLHYLQA
jgi:predicted nucleotide-binding protein (sugar kinase/HSP70/actin superfamily)